MNLSDSLTDAEYEKWIETLREQIQPLDLAELERKGIISKDKAQWYKVHDWNALKPGYISQKIKDIDTVKQRVKFYKGLEQSAAKVLAILEKERGKRE